MQTSIDFIPYRGYVVLALPQGFSDSSLIVHDTVLEKKREEYIRDGKELVVVAYGEGVDFVKLGDKVLVAGFGGLSKINIEKDSQPYYVIREASLLGKLD